MSMYGRPLVSTTCPRPGVRRTTTCPLTRMLTLGEPHAAMWDDDWTAVTVDGTRTAQFEHTLVIGEEGAERLTITGAGECAHDAIAAVVA